jgi:hypothetical protein
MSTHSISASPQAGLVTRSYLVAVGLIVATVIAVLVTGVIFVATEPQSDDFADGGIF